MRTEYKIFLGVALFLFGAAAVYGIYTGATAPSGGDGGESVSGSFEGGVEWVGTVALILSGLLCSMCGGFFWFVARRIDLRPEDREDGEIAEGAGELGFFSPGSYWPLGIALSGTVAGLGLALVQLWMVILGVLLILFTAGGLLFEYYVGRRAPLR